MSLKLIFVVFLFSLSTAAFSQNLKMNQPGLFPSLWMAGRGLVKSISDGLLNTEKIQEEAKRRDGNYLNHLARKKSYLETMSERRERIQELRQEKAVSNHELQAVGSKTSQELETELLGLIALGSLEEDSSDEESSLSMACGTLESSLLLQESPRSSNCRVPGIKVTPGLAGAGGGQAVLQPQEQALPAALRADLPDAWIPWGISKRVFGAMESVANASYKRSVVLSTDPEWRVVWRSFYRDKPTKWGIRRVSCVHDRDQTNRFEANLVTLEKDATTFLPTWDQEPQADQRAIVIGRWKNATAQFSPFQTMETDGRRRTWERTKVLPLWHGTGEDRCHSISNSGFTFFGKVALSGQAGGSTDDGYFGSGIYFTNSARYAADIYSQGHLMMSWVSMTEPFPVVGNPVQQDMGILRGKGAYKQYNAHYVPVVPVDNTFECPEYHPCQPGQSPVCDELVVFQRAQALPRYWVELQVEHPAMIAPSGIPAFVEDLIPHIMRVLSNPNVDADKKLRNVLNQKLAILMGKAGDDDLESDDLALFEQLGQLFDSNGRIVKAVRNAISGVAAQTVQVPGPVPVLVAPPAIPRPVVLSEAVVKTTAMTGDPLNRAGTWYEGPREARPVRALEWELGRKGSESMNFKDAQAYAVSRSAEGWRLPTVWELDALYQQRSVLGDDLDTSWFWSDTAIVGYDGFHGNVCFSEGDFGVLNDYVLNQVRLVRG